MTKLLRPSTVGPLLFVLVFWAGCTWGVGTGEEDTPAMHRNLSRAVDIQTGVVQGDLERARSAAAWIGAPENRALFPGQGTEYRDEMLRHAAEISSASELGVVAGRAGQLAAACGSCHQAAGRGPRFVVGSGPPGGQSQESHMVRHLWAADRMWEGLVGPAEDSWLAGARALQGTGPSNAGSFRGSMPTQMVEGFLRELNDLATEAEGATGQGERALTYGRILGTCHRCHASAGLPAY